MEITKNSEWRSRRVQSSTEPQTFRLPQFGDQHVSYNIVIAILRTFFGCEKLLKTEEKKRKRQCAEKTNYEKGWSEVQC